MKNLFLKENKIKLTDNRVEHKRTSVMQSVGKYFDVMAALDIPLLQIKNKSILPDLRFLTWLTSSTLTLPVATSPVPY